jgi:hypothetical protein
MKREGRPVFGQPIALRGTNQVMIPFAVEVPQVQGKDYFIGSISGGSYSVSGSAAWQGSSSSSAGYFFTGGDNLRWNNVAFYDPATGKARLLLDHPALICRFHASNDKGPVRGDYLLFGIAEKDTNQDGVLGADDAVRLYRTDAAGNGMLAITPDGTQMLDVTSFDDQRMYLRIRRDSDGDGKFTEKDLVEVFCADPRQWADPKTWRELEKVIPDDLRNRAFEAATKSMPHQEP